MVLSSWCYQHPLDNIANTQSCGICSPVIFTFIHVCDIVILWMLWDEPLTIIFHPLDLSLPYLQFTFSFTSLWSLVSCLFIFFPSLGFSFSPSGYIHCMMLIVLPVPSSLSPTNHRSYLVGLGINVSKFLILHSLLNLQHVFFLCQHAVSPCFIQNNFCNPNFMD